MQENQQHLPHLQSQNGRQRSREKNGSHSNAAMEAHIVFKASQSQNKPGMPISSAKQHPGQNDEEIDMFADDDLPDTVKNTAAQTVVTDELGYYNVTAGTIIGEKYRILAKIGRGVFGVVVKCERIGANEQKQGKLQQECAVKILRKNDLTRKSGEREYKILSTMHGKKKLRRIMQVYDYFQEQGHLCLVCELLSIDLRSYAHKKEVTLDDIRLYAIGMFLISHQLRLGRVVHADIKLDNFMFKTLPEDQEGVVSEQRVVDNIRLVDFGTAFWVQQYNCSSEEIVARYYRAPQIILGTEIKASQTYAIDVWAMGCSLYELYTGNFLFNGDNNNEMLRQMMETKGKFSMKMLNKSLFREKYFDSDYNFLSYSVDRVSKELKTQKVQVTVTAEREMMNLLKKNGAGKRAEEDIKKLQHFRDFLEKCLTLNPKDRLLPQEAMEHPFLHYQIKLQ